jgi:glycosyltransferase involved in cell wall biosynthesis/spore maturation protein CgeB
MSVEHKKFRVLLLDTKKENPNHYICLAIYEALQNNSEVDFVAKVNLGNAISIARKNQCNLFFAFDGEELNSEVCFRLSKICDRSILWVTEDPYELPQNKINSSIFDIIFTNDSFSAAEYGTKGVHLPLGASKTFHFHRVKENFECLYHVFFAGTAWPNRVDLLNKIIKSISNLRLKIALSSNAHIPEVKIDLPKSSYSWRVPNIEFSRFANNSNVVLGLHRDYSTSAGAKTASTTPGPRIFEVAMAGGFQLVDDSLVDLKKYFEIDREIITFSNPQECVQKLNYFLENPEKRIAIAKAAQDRALADHTYTSRVQFILDKINNTDFKAKDMNQRLIDFKRPRVLMVTHNILGKNNWGGVELYQDWIRKEFSATYEIWYYVPEHSDCGKTFKLLNEDLEIIEKFNFSFAADPAVLSSHEREAAFSSLLVKHRISLAHFQHFLLNAPSLPLIAKSLGVPVVITLHDYYSICHHYTLVGMTGQYCGVETQTESGCDLCLSKTLGAVPGSQQARRGFYSRILESADILHVNTIGVRKRIELVYGSLKKHAGWEVMGVPVKKIEHLKNNSLRKLSSKLRVAVPGNFTKFKGGDLLLNTFKLLNQDNVEFVIFGRIDSEYKGLLTTGSLKNVKVYGQYDSKDIQSLLNDFDVSVHISIWPETYCLTLSEAFGAGIVPIVSDIGALGERVIDGVNGFKFELYSPGSLVDIIRYLIGNRGLIDKLKDQSCTDNVTEEKHKAWLLPIYQKLIQDSKLNQSNIYLKQAISLDDCGIALEKSNWLYN